MKKQNSNNTKKQQMINTLQREPIYVLTHNDMDGNMAAYVAELFVNVDCYDAVAYGKVTEKLDQFFQAQNDNNTYGGIIVTDVNLNMEQLQRLNDAAKDGLPVLYFDHHHKNQAQLDFLKSDECKIYATLRDEESATKIIYEWLTRNGFPMTCNNSEHTINVERLEEIINNVDAWDTFKWVDAETYDVLNEGARDLSMFFSAKGARRCMDKIDNYVFDIYERLFSNTENAILKDAKMKIDRTIGFLDKTMARINVTISGHSYTCGVVYTDKEISFVGNKLAVLNPNIQFVVLINMNAKQVDFRGIREDINLAKIASAFDGGGHPKAAGCILNSAVFNTFVKPSVFKASVQKDIGDEAVEDTTAEHVEGAEDQQVGDNEGEDITSDQNNGGDTEAEAPTEE